MLRDESVDYHGTSARAFFLMAADGVMERPSLLGRHREITELANGLRGNVGA
jgi:hypothetical protein